jgi:hypothetical protein
MKLDVCMCFNCCFYADSKCSTQNLISQPSVIFLRIQATTYIFIFRQMGNIQTIKVMAVQKEHRLMWDLRFSEWVLIEIPVFWDVTNGYGINAPVRIQPSTHSNKITQMVALSTSDGRISILPWQWKCHHQVSIQVSIHVPNWIQSGWIWREKNHCLVWEFFITIKLCYTPLLMPHHTWQWCIRLWSSHASSSNIFLSF